MLCGACAAKTWRLKRSIDGLLHVSCLGDNVYMFKQFYLLDTYPHSPVRPLKTAKICAAFKYSCGFITRIAFTFLQCQKMSPMSACDTRKQTSLRHSSVRCVCICARPRLCGYKLSNSTFYVTAVCPSSCGRREAHCGLVETTGDTDWAVSLTTRVTNGTCFRGLRGSPQIKK